MGRGVAMDIGRARERRTLRFDSAVTGGRWRYEGIGWPRSLAEIRLWIPGVAALVALTIWGYVAIGPNGRLVPGQIDRHRTDFTVFTEAGAAFFDGRNPYRIASPRGWHYLYPPLFALFVSPLAAFDTESQVLAWYAVNVGLAFLCFGEMRRLWRLACGAARQEHLWVAACAFLATFLPFLDCMQAGQLGIAILYLLMRGFRLRLERRPGLGCFVAGVILALPAVVKLVPALPVAFLLFQRWYAATKPGSGPRPWVRAASLTAGVSAGVLLFLLAIPASVIGWRANLAHLHQWYKRVVANERVGPDANFNIHSYRNQSLANAVYLLDRAASFGSRPDPRGTSSDDRPERIVHPAVRGMAVVTLAVLLAVGLALGRHEDPLHQVTAYGLACCATLIVSPLSWGHYYMAQAPAVLFVPLWLLRFGRPLQARVAAAIPPILSWSYYVAMPFAGGLGLLGLGTTVWFLAVCGLILRNRVVTRSAIARPHFLRRDLRSPAPQESPPVPSSRGEAMSARPVS
jgi:hypothetical protein